VSTVAGIRFKITPSREPVSAAEREQRLANPGFGRIFTDHLVSIKWEGERGWYDAELRPYGPLVMDPGTVFLHYAQGIFEGLKAYRQADGGVAVFRPDQNAARFRRSSRRMALPELPEETFVESIDLLLKHDHEWVPSAPDHSLYLRPFMFASNVGLGVHMGGEVTFLLIASPSGPYFKNGVKPVTVWLEEKYTRAAPGGTGEAKFGGNYAGGLIAQAEALRQGCDDVVWLDAAEHRWVEEMGGMNLCFVFDTGGRPSLVTSPLTGTLLPGVTRDSLLKLAADMGYGVEERSVSVEEWREGCADGSVAEAFACGTAAVITPVGEVRSAHGGWKVAGGAAGPITMKLREALVAIQRGNAPDTHHWMHQVDLQAPEA
jgi:branched-chain amino acid aminotransferase